MRRARTIDALSRCGLLSSLALAIRWSGVLCLNYHRIGDGRESLFDRGVWSASAEDFDEHVRFLSSHFDVVTPLDLPEILRRRKGRFVLITFDDGYLDNYQTAFPILKRHRVPATFFVATGFVDNPRLSWWDEVAWMARTSPKSGIEAGRWLSGPVLFDDPDRESAVGVLLQAYKAMPSDSTDEFLGYLADATGSGRFDEGVNGHWWMTWDMLREMRAAGMVIGGHTVNHPVLAQLPVERQCAEIEGCGRRLAEELGEPMRHFSYPVGERYSFTSATRACLQKAGVRYAFSYYGGTRRYRRWDDLDIRRIAVESYMDPDWLRAAVKLPGIFGKAR